MGENTKKEIGREIDEQLEKIRNTANDLHEDNFHTEAKILEDAAETIRYLSERLTVEETHAVKDVREEIQPYCSIGTVEEIQEMQKEEDILKFYYCESKDEYYIGKRIDTMYYAKYSKTGFTWFMSRFLPWGKHIVSHDGPLKEYTYPSEPMEIPFYEWLQGFIRKECFGTIKECQQAMDRQRAKKPNKRSDKYTELIQHYSCPVCGRYFGQAGVNNTILFDKEKYCKCGQAIDWRDE